MIQNEYLSKLYAKNKNAIFIGSLGTICYDLDKIKPKYYYPIRGAMGCAMAVGLGIALNTRKKVIVVIGDGSFLMKMGSMATIIAYKPKNLEVHIIKNGVYASTGGQKVHFDSIDHLTPYFPFKVYSVV